VVKVEHYIGIGKVEARGLGARASSNVILELDDEPVTGSSTETRF
jgi:hypothetical protein